MIFLESSSPAHEIVCHTGVHDYLVSMVYIQERRDGVLTLVPAAGVDAADGRSEPSVGEVRCLHRQQHALLGGSNAAAEGVHTWEKQAFSVRGVQTGRNALRNRHINGMEVRKKRPRGFT